MILKWVLCGKGVSEGMDPGLGLLSGCVNVPLDVRGICWLF